MKKTLRIVILSEMKQTVSDDLGRLEEFYFVTSDISERKILRDKINYSKSLLNEIDQMIEEL